MAEWKATLDDVTTSAVVCAAAAAGAPSDCRPRVWAAASTATRGARTSGRQPTIADTPSTFSLRSDGIVHRGCADESVVTELTSGSDRRSRCENPVPLPPPGFEVFLQRLAAMQERQS